MVRRVVAQGVSLRATTARSSASLPSYGRRSKQGRARPSAANAFRQPKASGNGRRDQGDEEIERDHARRLAPAVAQAVSLASEKMVMWGYTALTYNALDA